MEHYIINTNKDIILPVKEHKAFYAVIGTSQTETAFKRIGLGKPEMKKMMEFVDSKNPNTAEIELFTMHNFPIMKCSVYGGDRNVSFTYISSGVSTYKAIEAVFDFCSKHYVPNIEIYNETSHKHVSTTWNDLKEDDSFIRNRLGSTVIQSLKDISFRLAAIPTLPLFDPDKATDELNKLRRNIDAGYVNAYVSTLGGKQNAAIMVTVTLEDQKDWKNGILQNAKYFHFEINRNGVVNNFRSEWKPAMRKFVAKNIDDVIMKINDYLKKGK